MLVCICVCLCVCVWVGAGAQASRTVRVSMMCRCVAALPLCVRTQAVMVCKYAAACAPEYHGARALRRDMNSYCGSSSLLENLICARLAANSHNDACLHSLTRTTHARTQAFPRSPPNRNTQRPIPRHPNLLVPVPGAGMIAFAAVHSRRVTVLTRSPPRRLRPQWAWGVSDSPKTRACIEAGDELMHTRRRCCVCVLGEPRTARCMVLSPCACRAAPPPMMRGPCARTLHGDRILALFCLFSAAHSLVNSPTNRAQARPLAA